MPSDWQLHDVEQLIANEKLYIGDGYRAKNIELSDTGLPFARVANVDNGFHFEGADCFPEEDLGKVGNKISRPGDVAFTAKGTVGRFAFVKPSVPRFVYSPQLAYWRSLDHGLIEPRFLFYWMQGMEFFVQARGVAGQTDMADYVSLTDQRRMKITLPPIDEQLTIASILGALDDKIELNRRLNETLEGIARAIFKSWFVDFDPVYAKLEGRDPGLPAHIADLFPGRLVDSELGEIPEGWRIRSLDEIAKYQNGLALQKYPAEEGEVFLHRIKIRELRQGLFDGKSEKSTSDIPDECIVYDGDVLFSWSGSLLIDLWTGGTGALNQHLFKVTSDQFSRWFYYFWTKHHLVEFQRIAAGKATTMGHIKRSHLSEAKAMIPSDSLLKACDEIIESYLVARVNNRLESCTVEDMRDTLLPKLISGELRAEDPEAFLERVM